MPESVIHKSKALCTGFVFTMLFLPLAFVVGCKPLKESKPQAKLVIDPKKISMGELEEGEEYTRKVKLTNVGSAKLKIYEAHSSCGCTVPDLKKRDLKPEESAEMEILIDTAMKQGDVTKTVQVSSNDPNSPIIPIRISMHVKNRHKTMGEEGVSKIFTSEKCTSCHVDKGVGLAGAELFEADCAMCHGKDAKGLVGGALVYGDYTNEKYVEHIRQVISYGSKTHRSMPGFLDKAGGPLIQEQVDSLVEYLKELSLKAKKEQSKMKS